MRSRSESGRRLCALLLGALVTVVAGAQTPEASSELEGSAWQLIKIEGSDGKIHAPTERVRYMISFAPHGELLARIDCNRGSGTWRSTDNGQLRFGDLATTRAQCAANSLYDLIVAQWTHVRSYALRDGHLFLTLPGDGVYEFEPLPIAAPTPAPPPKS